jgi:hypothetical protein
VPDEPEFEGVGPWAVREVAVGVTLDQVLVEADAGGGQGGADSGAALLGDVEKHGLSEQQHEGDYGARGGE